MAEHILLKDLIVIFRHLKDCPVHEGVDLILCKQQNLKIGKGIMQRVILFSCQEDWKWSCYPLPSPLLTARQRQLDQ